MNIGLALGVCVICAGVAATLAVSPVDAAQQPFSVCFDKALYKKGAFVDYQVRRTVDGRSEVRRFTYETSKSLFDDRKATEVETSIFGPDSVERTSEYYGFDGADLLRYGADSQGVTIAFDPPERTPTGLKEGETFKQTYGVLQGPAMANASRTVKFNGFEKLTTAAGKFKTCKLTKKTVVTARGAPEPVVTRNEVEWYAAEGPYLGFKLKVKTFGREFGSDFNATFEAVKFKTYDVD